MTTLNLTIRQKITVLIVAQPFPNRSFFACRSVAPSPSRQSTTVTRSVRTLNYGIYAHHVRCFQSQVRSYTIYDFMVSSPLQAEVKYKSLEHRGRLSFRKIRKKKKIQVSSCLCVQWIHLQQLHVYIWLSRECKTLHMMGRWEGGQYFWG